MRGAGTMKWHKQLLSKLQERRNKKIVLAIDTSTTQTGTLLIENIVKLFGQVCPEA